MQVLFFLGERRQLSRARAPELGELARRYEGTSINRIGIFSPPHSTRRGLHRFREQYCLPFELRLDRDQRIRRRYGVTHTPTAANSTAPRRR